MKRSISCGLLLFAFAPGTVRAAAPESAPSTLPASAPASLPSPESDAAAKIRSDLSSTGKVALGSDEASIPALDSALATPGLVHVSIATTPSGASVTLDGKKLGTSPVATSVTAGTHRLRLELAGYRPKNRKLKLKPHTDRIVTTRLATMRARANSIRVLGIVFLGLGGMGVLGVKSQEVVQ
jgi:hypothetical protein